RPSVSAPSIELPPALVEYWQANHAAEEVRAVSARVLAPFEEGSAEWLQALAPLCVHLYFAAEVGWVPAARRALAVHGHDLALEVRGRLELGLSFGPAFQGLPEGIAALERAAELGRAAGNRELEVVALLSLASTLAGQGERARARPLVAWLDRHVPRDAVMRFLLDASHANAAAFDGDFAGAQARFEPYLQERPQLGMMAQSGLVALWAQDGAGARRALAAAERHPAFRAWATTMAWVRAVVPLLEGGLEAACRTLDDEPAPWLMGTASFRIRCLG